jgi:fructokinase
MGTRRRIHALVVGATSRDLGPGDDVRDPGCPGGVVVHAGLALARLGACTRVVTRLEPGDVAALLAPLESEGVAVAVGPSRATTTYRNDYAGPVDRHELLVESDPIVPADVPAAWRHADLVQLGPLHPRDVLPETAAVLRGLRGLDVQGLVRAPAGMPPSPLDTALTPFADHVDVVQMSETDLPALLDGRSPESVRRHYGIPELIVTRGARGATVTTGAGTWEIAGVPVAGGSLVGAGDVFLAAYLFARVAGHEPAAAGAFAARTSAAKIARGRVPRGSGRDA